MTDDGNYSLPALPGLPPKDMAGPFSWCNWVIGKQVAFSPPRGIKELAIITVF